MKRNRPRTASHIGTPTGATKEIGGGGGKTQAIYRCSYCETEGAAQIYEGTVDAIRMHARRRHRDLMKKTESPSRMQKKQKEDGEEAKAKVPLQAYKFMLPDDTLAKFEERVTILLDTRGSTATFEKLKEEFDALPEKILGFDRNLAAFYFPYMLPRETRMGFHARIDATREAYDCRLADHEAESRERHLLRMLRERQEEQELTDIVHVGLRLDDKEQDEGPET